MVKLKLPEESKVFVKTGAHAETGIDAFVEANTLY
jgi:hypothetical protein